MTEAYGGVNVPLSAITRRVGVCRRLRLLNEVRQYAECASMCNEQQEARCGNPRFLRIVRADAAVGFAGETSCFVMVLCTCKDFLCFFNAILCVI